MTIPEPTAAPQPLEDPKRLAVFARRHRHLVPGRRKTLDDRPQHQRVRGGGAVDPDPQTAAAESCG